jgi:hypothetical protein
MALQYAFPVMGSSDEMRILSRSHLWEMISTKSPVDKSA